MTLANTHAVLALGAVSLVIASCSPVSAPKAPSDENPLEGTATTEVDTSHIGEPPPVKQHDAPDMEYLIDMAGRSGRQALKCDMPDIKGPREVATVDVTFEPTGWSGAVEVQKPHEGTPMGECIQRAFQKVPVTNFKGAPVTLEQKIDFSKKTIDKATPRGAATPAPSPEESKDKPGGGYY